MKFKTPAKNNEQESETEQETETEVWYAKELFRAVRSVPSLSNTNWL
jgi:hypothetical protein